MHILQKWLESEQDFKQGLLLFKASGGSPTWQNLFEKLGESTYTRVELYKQIDNLLLSIEEKVMPIASAEIKPTLRASEKDSAPTIIKKIVEERKQKFSFANQLHHTLVLHVESMILKNTPIVDAKSTVFELRENLQKIDEAWSITDKYDVDPVNNIPKEPGEEKVKKAKIVDINHAADRRRSLKVYLSESYLKRKKPEERAAFIERTQRELEELNLLIAENERTIPIQ